MKNAHFAQLLCLGLVLASLIADSARVSRYVPMALSAAGIAAGIWALVAWRRAQTHEVHRSE